MMIYLDYTDTPYIKFIFINCYINVILVSSKAEGCIEYQPALETKVKIESMYSKKLIDEFGRKDNAGAAK